MTSNRRRSRKVRAAMSAGGYSYSAAGRRLDREYTEQNRPLQLTVCPRPQDGEGLAGWLARVSTDLGLNGQQTLRAVGLGSNQPAAERLRSLVADPEPTWAVMERFAAATGLEPSGLSDMIDASRTLALSGAPDPVALAQTRTELATTMRTAMEDSNEPGTGGHFGHLQIAFEPHELNDADITEIESAIRQAGETLGWDVSVAEHTRYILVEDLRKLPSAAIEAYDTRQQRTTSEFGHPEWREEHRNQLDRSVLPVHATVRQLLDRITSHR